MQQQPRYPSMSIIIPARNEAQNLYHILPGLASIAGEIILVDGHSTDDTIEVAKQLIPSIRILQQPGRGKGDALRAGFAASTGDILVMFDADGSADPAEIDRFVAALMRNHDFVKGSRYIKGGGSRDLTWLRSLGNYGLCTVVNILFQRNFSDFCYGYNAFWRHCLDRLDLDCTGFEIEAQLCLRMHRAGFNIVEVPSVELERIYGESNLHAFRDGWRILKTILRERFAKAPAPCYTYNSGSLPSSLDLLKEVSAR